MEMIKGDIVMKKKGNRGHNIFIYFSVFLITFSLFSYEVLLTRLFSVIGSILAISISMKLGFNITIILGALLYLYLYIKNPLKTIS